MKISFKTVTSRDIKQWLDSYEHTTDLNEEECYLLCSDFISDMYDNFHMILLDNESIGYLSTDRDNVRYLKKIWIDPKYRKHGIGLDLQ